MSDLVLYDQHAAVMPVMALEVAKQRRDALVAFTKSIMINKQDYGVIPGTGDKATLLKPGAEKLCSFFGLSPKFELVESVKDWTGDDHGQEPFFYFEYCCTLYRDGVPVGQGNGNCNSWEKKYRYRTVYANRATAEDKERGRLETRKGRNGNYQVYVVPNPDPADLVNTISKMAQKRALVAATLIAVNASEFFTQDIEDMTTGDFVDGAWFDSPSTEPAQTPKSEPKLKPNTSNGTTQQPAPQRPPAAQEADDVDYLELAYNATTLRAMAANLAQADKGYTSPEHVVSSVKLLNDGQIVYSAAENRQLVDRLLERKPQPA